MKNWMAGRVRPALLVVCLAAVGLARADGGSDAPAPGEATKVNGYVSFSYGTNRNDPPSDTSQYRVFDSATDRARLDVASLVVHRDAEKPRDVGFRIDAAVGSGIPPVTAATGLGRDPATGEAQNVDLMQAYVGYVVPLGSGLHVDAGKFISHMGYESIDRWDGINDNASRSLLFGYAVPFTQTGVRAGYTFSPRLVTALYVLNGWDTVKTTNGFRTLGAQAAVTLSDTSSLVLNLIDGPEQHDHLENRRRVVDLCATVKPLAALSLGVNADYGHEPGAAPGGGAATWRGIALYATLKLGGAWSIAARGEVFDDVDGVRTGTVQRLHELTITPAVKIAERLIVRLDVRLDRSDQPVFESSSGQKTTQPTLLLNLALPL